MYRGHSINDPLSKTGWQQMYDAIGDYNYWDRIITSPLSRCQDFAEKLSKQHDIPLTIVDTLKEVSFGSWEGKTAADIDPQEYRNFYLDPVNNRPYGSEQLGDFINRVVLSWKELLTRYYGKHLLIVAHAGVIRAIIAQVLFCEPIGLYKMAIDNGKISRIQITERSGQVLKMLNGNLT
jgi:probable phosphoglycerate mutase